MIRLNHSEESSTLFLEISEKLRKEDYEEFVQVVESMLQKHGKIRMLVEMRDFHGWVAGALWEDIKFDVRHFNDIERLALIGDKQWQKGMAVFCKPFKSQSALLRRVRSPAGRGLDRSKGLMPVHDT
jgi:hypothetical protein